MVYYYILPIVGYNNFLASYLCCIRCSTDASVHIVLHLHLCPHPTVGTARRIALSALCTPAFVSDLRLLVIDFCISPFLQTLLFSIKDGQKEGQYA